MMRKFATLLLLLWLPLQGFAAVAMPFCQHALGGGNHHDSSDAAAHERHSLHHGATPDDSHDSDASQHGLDCNNCGACQLACSPAVPISVQVTRALEPDVALPPYRVSLRLFEPEQPLPPPLA